MQSRESASPVVTGEEEEEGAPPSQEQIRMSEDATSGFMVIDHQAQLEKQKQQTEEVSQSEVD